MSTTDDCVLSAIVLATVLMVVWINAHSPRPIRYYWLAIVAAIWVFAIASAPTHTWADKLYLGTLVFAVVVITALAWANERRDRAPRDQP